MKRRSLEDLTIHIKRISKGIGLIGTPEEADKRIEDIKLTIDQNRAYKPKSLAEEKRIEENNQTLCIAFDNFQNRKAELNVINS